MKRIWIIGAGRFGLMAADRLAETHCAHHLVLVDPNIENLQQGKGANRTLVQMDGVLFVHQGLGATQQRPDWIIPALPIHLAAGWCLEKRRENGLEQIGMPIELDGLLPNAMQDDTGNLYASHADFLCPDTCDEPADFCSVTRKKRQTDMFDWLDKIKLNDVSSHVIRSCQLGPGIGGYRPQQLFDLLERVDRYEKTMIISTACRCHSVSTAFAYR